MMKSLFVMSLCVVQQIFTKETKYKQLLYNDRVKFNLEIKLFKKAPYRAPEGPAKSSAGV